jgi:hypothetical protein
MFDIFIELRDFRWPVLKRQLSMLYQFVLSPIEEPDEEQILAVFQVNPKIFLLQAITNRKELDKKLWSLGLWFLVLFQGLLQLNLDMLPVLFK